MKIALIGYGKMGKAIEALALQKGHEIVLKISLENMHEFTETNLQRADIAVEFTDPHSAFENVTKCLNAGIPVVCGSTGWLGKYDQAVKITQSTNSALLYSSNFSIGVNIFFELNKKLAQLMSDQNNYDVTMEEIHHAAKKDSPSGTAITLAEDILQFIKRKKAWVNRSALNKEELSIVSQRIDPAPGTHKIKYHSSADDIEIIHTAHDRTGFAAGAILAAEFLQKKKGVYSMRDVLGL